MGLVGESYQDPKWSSWRFKILSPEAWGRGCFRVPWAVECHMTES